MKVRETNSLHSSCTSPTNERETAEKRGRLNTKQRAAALRLFWRLAEQLRRFMPVLSFHLSPICVQQLPVPEGSEVLGISHGRVQASRPRHVDVEALACSRADLEPNMEKN